MIFSVSDRRKRILGLALPIVGGMFSQNILNLIDTAMVGSLGSPALAAVGLGAFATFMSQSILLGLSSGVQTMAARRRGEGRSFESAIYLNGALIVALFLGLFLSFLLSPHVEELFQLLNSDPAVQKQGVPYLSVRMFGIPFIAMNMSFRGYWNAMDLSKVYMRTLIVMHLSNVALNYVLIFGHFGFEPMGTQGAGIATVFAQMLGTLIYFSTAFSQEKKHGFLKGVPNRDDFKTLLKLCIPMGIQQFFFSSGYTTLYWIIGKIGTIELAAANVLLNVMLIAILPSMAMGIASTTLVSQAIGEREIEQAKKWPGEVILTGLPLLIFLGALLVFVPEWILHFFLKDTETLEVAKVPMQIAGITIWMDLLAMVYMNSLLGAGESAKVMKTSIVLQWILFLPLAYFVGPYLGGGLVGVWTAQAVYRMIQMFGFSWIWKSGSWETVKI
ncbi:MAG: MATE family efflux transporter [Bdellovibrionaceae bacterium]|nr:MATE family efflux transporter [Pseudobdellovibrionaceae bacterium]